MIVNITEIKYRIYSFSAEPRTTSPRPGGWGPLPAMAFEASLMLIILRWSLVVTVKSLETCRLETETM